jgi:hypothetical protein
MTPSVSDASLSLARGILACWIRQHGDEGLALAPDFVLAVIDELRSFRDAQKNTPSPDTATENGKT